MNEYKDTADKTEIYLVDFLQTQPIGWSDFRRKVVLISLVTLLIFLSLLSIFNKFPIVFSASVCVLTLLYFIGCTVIIFNGVKKYEYRTDELSKFVLLEFSRLKQSRAKGRVDSTFLWICLIIFSFVVYCFSIVILCKMLLVSPELVSNDNIKLIVSSYIFVLLFSLIGPFSIYSLTIACICIFMKIKKLFIL